MDDMCDSSIKSQKDDLLCAIEKERAFCVVVLYKLKQVMTNVLLYKVYLESECAAGSNLTRSGNSMPDVESLEQTVFCFNSSQVISKV